MNTIISSHYLAPAFGVREKSFYKKAKVKVFADGSKVLQSYDTDVCKMNPDGTLERLWDSRSATTQRHIQAFTGMTKKEYESATYKSIYKLKRSRYYIGGGQFQTIIEDVEL